MNRSKIQIKKKIAQDQIEEAIWMMLDASDQDQDVKIFNELILVSLSYHRLKNNLKTSQIGLEQFNIELLKTARRLLDLIDAKTSDFLR